MPAEKSWHIPFIDKYRAPSADAALNAVYLQRMTDEEQQQVEQALKNIDQEAIQQLKIPQTPAPRRLRFKKWIRDYPASSAATLEIAKDAYHKQYDSEESYNSVIFVDSGWESGSVIAAHWHQDGESDGAKVSAARVSTGIANILLTACDRYKGMTLSQALGDNAFQQVQVDLYKDLPATEQAATSSEPSELAWPSHLPETFSLGNSPPVIVSLKHLDNDTIRRLKQGINSGSDAVERDVKVYNWKGPTPTSRLVVRDLFNLIQCKTPEADQDRHAFFIDYMLEGENGEPQILSVARIPRVPGIGVEVLPVYTSSFLAAWEKAAKGEALDKEKDIVDIWKMEHIDHFNTAKPASVTTACPVFFLHPFTQEEERRARAATCALGDVEEGQDWGHLFIWHGYLFNDGKEHTLEDLRELFESSDPYSPFFDKEKASPYRLGSYPRNFVALDDKALDPETPQAWMASALDFHGEDSPDQLGWITGRIDAAQTFIKFANLDIANLGPEECFDEDTVDKLWLSDLKAYREGDWKDEQKC